MLQKKGRTLMIKKNMSKVLKINIGIRKKYNISFIKFVEVINIQSRFNIITYITESIFVEIDDVNKLD